MVTAINHALTDASWYCEGRANIRENILGPLDGRATKRLANLIIESGGKK
jgi:hypothetical protein